MKGQTSFFGELIVDNFAGGGGASTGIELATGRPVDIAINHSPEAILMHQTNHPYTRHLCDDVWEVDPKEICAGQKVGLAWFSPDCTHHSKARGGKPKEKKIRGLAWVAVRWAATVRPRVIVLENVEEFRDWGPLIQGFPDVKRKGETFNSFVNALKRLGYIVEHKELKACDYGAPTTRKRLFIIARCDSRPIVWPESTHGPGKIPYKSASDIINWEIPCPSIFATSEEIWEKYRLKAVRPLAENTLRRIARGMWKFVIESPEPFIVPGPDFPRAGFLTQYHKEQGEKEVRGQKVADPIFTIDASPRYGLVTAFLSKFFSGGYTGAGNSVKDPLSTVTAWDHNALVTSHICTMRNNQFADMKAFLLKYYGAGTGQTLNAPIGTVTSKDRFGLVTIHGTEYAIVDIGLRMLTPRELYNAQGFPPDYIIDRDYTGKTCPKSEQIARCGNAVPPPFAEAIVRANVPEMCGRKYRTMEELINDIAM